MNSKLIAVTFIGMTTMWANAAFADRSQQIPYSTTTNTTRAAVMAELAKARVDGSLYVSRETGELNAPAAQNANQLTRAEVMAEYTKARANGSLFVSNEKGEFDNFPAQKATRSPSLATSTIVRAAGEL